MPAYEFPGVPMIYLDKVEAGCNRYDCEEAMFVTTGRHLVRPPDGSSQVVLQPVYEGQPSQAEVTALIERYRMTMGSLPHVVIVAKIVRSNHDPAAVAEWRKKRAAGSKAPAPRHEEMVLGYNVILRSAARRMSA